jgi:DNA-binding CsgD family transcriptional regulator
MPPRNGRHSGDSKSPGAKHSSPNEPRALTAREREVVEWIAEGKRNREIGEILGCSSRTVQKHVQHILEKLHAETRTAVCTWWHENQRDNKKSRRR